MLEGAERCCHEVRFETRRRVKMRMDLGRRMEKLEWKGLEVERERKGDERMGRERGQGEGKGFRAIWGWGWE